MSTTVKHRRHFMQSPLPSKVTHGDVVKAIVQNVEKTREKATQKEIAEKTAIIKYLLTIIESYDLNFHKKIDAVVKHTLHNYDLRINEDDTSDGEEEFSE